MFSQPSLTSQPEHDTNRNNMKNAVKAILILILVVVIVILLSLAVILSGRTAINPMQTPSPTPTTTPTVIQVRTGSFIVVSMGILQPHKPKARLGLKTEKRAIGGA
jgi:flagellar basal body-associated protein FliL